MKTLRFFLLFATFIVLTSSTRCARAETIRNFNADVRVREDSTLEVVENIVMDFEGARRRGIFRTIPIRYARNSNSYSIYIRDISVRDGNGRALEYSLSSGGGFLTLKIGNPDIYLTGVQTYVIAYSVRRAINFFDNAPEVYWNATGDQWQFPIQKATARFFWPSGVKIPQVKSRSFRGQPFSTEAAQTQNNANNVFSKF